MFLKKIINIIILGFIVSSNITLAKEIIISKKNLTLLNNLLIEVFNITVDKARIETLQGGFSGDEIFLISYDNNKIVVRIYKKNKNIKHKLLEYEATKNAFELGIGPKILYVSKDYDLIATEYINSRNPDVKTFQKERQINYLVESLLKLHNGPRFSNNWSIFDYIKKIVPKTPNEKENLAIAELNKLIGIFQKSRFQKSPCHNDIQPNNLFVINDKILFIDWGDAGMNDPFWDLARISIEFAFNSEQDELLLSKYLGKVTKLDQSRFFIMKQIFFLRSAFWLRNITGRPDKKKLDDIIRIFEVNNHPINVNNKKITWKYLYNHVIDLFLKNTKTALYQESLKILNQ